MKTTTMKTILVMLGLIFLQGCGLRSYEGPRIVNLQNGICQDKVTGAMWQEVKSERLTNIEEARAFARSQKLGGYDDWRLPTVYELYDLNYLRDLHIPSECRMDLEGNFWSDEKDGDGMVGAWEISDQCDPVRQYAPAAEGYVRVIRP